MENTYNNQIQTVGSMIESMVIQGNKRMSDSMIRYDLTLAQFLAMDALAKKGSECSMSELAERIQQSSATMTGIVDRLVEKKWVERHRSEEDRRAVFVGLTAEGTDLLLQVNSAKVSWIDSTLRKLEMSEVETLSVLIRKLMQVAELDLSQFPE